MTLVEAIKIKENHYNKYEKHMLSSERDADKMSIKALELIQTVREKRLPGYTFILPGETPAH